jgi:hypothetical protein
MISLNRFVHADHFAPYASGFVGFGQLDKAFSQARCGSRQIGLKLVFRLLGALFCLPPVVQSQGLY